MTDAVTRQQRIPSNPQPSNRQSHSYGLIPRFETSPSGPACKPSPSAGNREILSRREERRAAKRNLIEKEWSTDSGPRTTRGARGVLLWFREVDDARDRRCCGVAASGSFLEIGLPLRRFAFCEVIHEFASGADLIQNRLRPSRRSGCEPPNGCLDSTREPFCKRVYGNFVGALLSERPNSLNHDSSFGSRAKHLGGARCLSKTVWLPMRIVREGPSVKKRF
jgi:hypothetical protein